MVSEWKLFLVKQGLDGWSNPSGAGWERYLWGAELETPFTEFGITYKWLLGAFRNGFRFAIYSPGWSPITQQLGFGLFAGFGRFPLGIAVVPADPHPA